MTPPHVLAAAQTDWEYRGDTSTAEFCLPDSARPIILAGVNFRAAYELADAMQRRYLAGYEAGVREALGAVRRVGDEA